MNKVSLSKNRASLCYKNTCINTTGDIAKVITYSVAFMIVASSVASLLNATSKQFALPSNPLCREVEGTNY